MNDFNAYFFLTIGKLYIYSIQNKSSIPNIWQVMKPLKVSFYSRDMTSFDYFSIGLII